jgi:hypothetical protein
MKTKSRLLKHSAKPRYENHQQTPQTLRPTVIWKPKANSSNNPPNRYVKNQKQNPQTLKWNRKLTDNDNWALLGSIIVTSGKLMKCPGRSRSMLISGLPIFLLQLLPKLGRVLIIMPPDWQKSMQTIKHIWNLSTIRIWNNCFHESI